MIHIPGPPSLLDPLVRLDALAGAATVIVIEGMCPTGEACTATRVIVVSHGQPEGVGEGKPDGVGEGQPEDPGPPEDVPRGNAEGRPESPGKSGEAGPPDDE